VVLVCPLPPSRERLRRFGKSIVYDAHKTIGDTAIPKMSKGWEDQVKSMLKAELKRRGLSCADLVGKLADIGVMDSESNIRNKLSRGKFTAVFLIQCLEAIGA
jgi:hypothetical protein